MSPGKAFQHKDVVPFLDSLFEGDVHAKRSNLPVFLKLPGSIQSYTGRRSEAP